MLIGRFVESGWFCNSMQPTCTLQLSISIVKCPPVYGSAMMGGRIKFPKNVFIVLSISSLIRRIFLGWALWSSTFRKAATLAKRVKKYLKTSRISIREQKSAVLCGRFEVWIVSAMWEAISKCPGYILCPRLAILSVTNKQLYTLSLTPACSSSFSNSSTWSLCFSNIFEKFRRSSR